MLHITRIISLVPRSEGSEDCFITMIFSNGNTKNMVLTAAARADLIKHLLPKKDPSSQAQPKKKPPGKSHQ
ncbi:hypothetical protein ES708_29541 [subsurface metagenome]